MAGQLHEKYRPTRFKDVIGHTEQIKSLKKVVKEKRAHVFLFTGPAGIGKTTLARILANEFCGGKATVANIEEIPAALFTGVDAMRQVVAKAQYRAIGNSPVKVIILDEAHRLSGAAWDGLLKAVEEPPSHVYYIFCTTVSGKIPKTILTRCQQYDFKPLAEEELLEVVTKAMEGEGLEISEEVVEVIVESAGGSARQALAYLESCQYCESASEARKILMQAGETPEVVELARFLLNRKGRDWKTAQRILNGLKGMEAESIRIVVANYLAAVILGSKSEKDAIRVLTILENFENSFYAPDKMAPLILAVARSIGMADE